MGNELLLIIGFTVFSLFVTAAWVGGYLDPYQKKLQNLALDKMGDNRASYGIKSTEHSQRTHEIRDRKANDPLQVPYLHLKQETRTSTKCKANWATTLEARLAEEVLEKALAALCQRGYDLARITVTVHKLDNCWQRIYIHQEASIPCFSIVKSNVTIHPKTRCERPHFSTYNTLNVN